MNIKLIFTLVTSFFLVFTQPSFAKNTQVIKDKQLVVIEVFDAPVGFQSEFKGNSCRVITNLVPMKEIRVNSGESVEIKVLNDDDIVIKCNKDKSITINRK